MGELVNFENVVSMNQLAASRGLARQGAGQSLDQLEREIRPDATSSVLAARLYAVLQHERKGVVPPEVLDRLSYSVNPADQARALLYADPAPPADLVKGLIPQFTGTRFLDRMSAVHAREAVGDKGAREELLPRSRTLGRLGLVLAALGVFSIGIVLWLYLAICRAEGARKPLGSPLQPISRYLADGLALQVAMFLVLLFLLPTALAPLGPAATLAAFPLALAAVLVMPRYGIGVNLGQTLGPPIKPSAAVGWGLAGWAANLPLMLLIGGLGVFLFRGLPEPSHPAVEVLQGSASSGQIFRVFLLGVVFAPFLEEVVFRGMLLPALIHVTRRPWVAVVVSSLLFAAIHPQGIAAWFALATVGAMCAMLTLQTRSLWPAIIMHAVHNLVLLSINTWVL